MATIFYRLTATGNYKNINWNNVFHFRTNDTDDPSAQELANIFDVEWTNALRDILNVVCLINKYYAVRVDDLGDYGEHGVNNYGLVGTSGSALPPQWATCFTMNTVGSAIRHGFKRFTGVDEAMITGGDPSTPFVAPFNVISAKLASTLNGVAAEYEPVVPRYNTASPPAIVLAAAVASAGFKRFNTQRSRIP